jgi:molybdopterin converting factor small subunit
MRDLTSGEDQVDVSGKTLRHVIDALDHIYPGFKTRLCEGERLNPAIAASVDGRISRLGLSQPVDVDSEIRFLPPVHGG